MSLGLFSDWFAEVSSLAIAFSRATCHLAESVSSVVIFNGAGTRARCLGV